MMYLIAGHAALALAVALAVVLLATAAVLAAATRTRDPDTARHRGTRRSYTWRHRARHAAAYMPRHEQAARGPVVLGTLVDGDITLVHADPPAEPAAVMQLAEEPTVETRALAGASA